MVYFNAYSIFCGIRYKYTPNIKNRVERKINHFVSVFVFSLYSSGILQTPEYLELSRNWLCDWFIGILRGNLHSVLRFIEHLVYVILCAVRVMLQQDVW